MKKKICVVTGSRAEYGLLKPLLDELKSSSETELSLIATGMHLSPEFGSTYKQIESDGFKIDKKIEVLLSSDTHTGVAKAVGLGCMSFAEAFAEMSPDILVLLGDRFETFAAATAAMVSKIPIAHIHGGETTEGAIDEAIRHSITKMSHIHFTSTAKYRERVIQLGENPATVHNVGAIGLDNIKKIKLLEKKELEKELDFEFGEKNLLVTFHPATLDQGKSETQFNNLLKALDEFKDTKIIFTLPNADAGGREIIKLIDDYTKQNKNSKAYTSLGQLKYLSALKYVNGVVGNSSSGIIEVPSFHIGTVNIGSRQRGRIMAESVINCLPNTEAISESIKKLFSDEFNTSLKDLTNPYGDGHTSNRIYKTLIDTELNGILQKSFYDLEKNDK